MKTKILFAIMLGLALTITAKENNSLKDGFTFGNPDMISIKTIAYVYSWCLKEKGYFFGLSLSARALSHLAL